MIETKDVGVTISKKMIVHDVSIDVEKGKFIGIIGPNGSGKSTLLKSIYRVLKPSSGHIIIDGNDINDLSLKESALIVSVVGQHNYYNFDFKALDVVLMGRTPHKQSMELDNEHDRAIADESIHKVGMDDFKDRSFYTLSGGEQQRIILARALTQETPCIILDEPTNHLDIKYQLQLLDIVKSSGLTVLCALHDLNLAAAYCDYIYVMKDGSIYTSGKAVDIITPEMIREVYGVESTVTISPNTGLLNIEYHPGFLHGNGSKH